MPYRRPRTWPRVLQYILYTAASLIGALEPSVILTHNFTSWVIYGWVLCLLIGAAACTIGALRNSWLGEYFGLPFMMFALGGYGLLALGTALFVNPAASLGALLYLAVAFGLLARLVEVSTLRKIAFANRPQRK